MTRTCACWASARAGHESKTAAATETLASELGRLRRCIVAAAGADHPLLPAAVAALLTHIDVYRSDYLGLAADAKWLHATSAHFDLYTSESESDAKAALEKSHEWGERIPIGLVYQADKPTYESTDPVLRKGPLTRANLRLDEKVFQSLIEELI